MRSIKPSEYVNLKSWEFYWWFDSCGCLIFIFCYIIKEHEDDWGNCVN